MNRIHSRILRGLAVAALTGLPLRAGEVRLEDYRPAAYHRHFLSLAPSLDFASEIGRYYSWTGESHSWNRSFVPRLALEYGARAWDTARAYRLAAGISGSGGLDGNNRRNDAPFPIDDAERRYRSVHSGSMGHVGAHFSGNGRRYFGPVAFIDASGEASAALTPPNESNTNNYNRYPSTDPEMSEVRISRYRSTGFGYSGYGNAGISLGIGRIVDVKFAATVLDMLDRAADAGFADSTMDGISLHELEAYVERRRKARAFLDRRRAAVYDMVSVQRFLARRTGKEIPAEALLAMADEWAYPSSLPRQSGWEAKAKPFAAARWMSDRRRETVTSHAALRPAAEDWNASMEAVEASEGSTEITRNRNFSGYREYGAEFRCDYHRPWHRHWQFAAGAYARPSRLETETLSDRSRSPFMNRDDRKDHAAYRYSSLWAGFNSSAAWIPHSRAFVRLTCRADGRATGRLENIEATDPIVNRGTGSITGTIALDSEYEVAPRLAVRGTLAYGSGWRDGGYSRTDIFVASNLSPYEESMWDTFRGNLGLTYYLF